MPASRSPSRVAKPARSSRSLWPWLLIGSCAIVAVIVVVLPASIVTRFLPGFVHAEGFSGTIWHGSAAKITVSDRDAGAIEWQIHPADLLAMELTADLHWVKVAFVVDCKATFTRSRFAVNDLKGGGPLDDLHNFGLAPNWHGNAALALSEIKGSYTRLSSAVGRIAVSDLLSPQFAEGADLGSFILQFGQDAVGADGGISAELSSTEGPVEIQAHARVSPTERTGTLAGTLRERPGAPPALHTQLENLSQIRGLDSQGRIPIDVEFTL